MKESTNWSLRGNCVKSGENQRQAGMKSVARGQLWATRNGLCPRTNILACFRPKWRLYYLSNLFRKARSFENWGIFPCGLVHFCWSLKNLLMLLFIQNCTRNHVLPIHFHKSIFPWSQGSTCLPFSVPGILCTWSFKLIDPFIRATATYTCRFYSG